MKRKSFVTTLLLSFACVFTLALGIIGLQPITAQAAITGDGTEESPYIVSTIDELNEALKKTDNEVNYVKVSNSVVGMISSSLKLGYNVKPFVLDLNGIDLQNFEIILAVDATIKNGTIKGSKQGIFVGSGATALNIKLENLVIATDYNGVSMLSPHGTLTIIDCQIESRSERYNALYATNSVTVNAKNVRLEGKPSAIGIDDTNSTVTLDGVSYTSSNPYIGVSYVSPHECVDANEDCKCDKMGEVLHLDADDNCVCDKEKCQKTVHTDENVDCVCDKCEKILHEYIDARCVYCREYSFQGEGTEESPYIVKVADELATAANMTENTVNYLVVVNDITADDYITLKKSVIMNLNENTLSFSSGGFLNIRKNATVKNGTITSTNDTYAIWIEGDSITLQGLTIKGMRTGVTVMGGDLIVDCCRITAYAEKSIALENNGRGVVTITNVYLEGNQSVFIGMDDDTIDGVDESEFELTTFYCTEHFCVYDNDDDTKCNICQGVHWICSHEYDNGCDVNCNECGNIRTPNHDFENFVWRYSEVGHWKKCGNCETEEDGSNVAAHTFGEWTDGETEGKQERVCECGYKQTRDKVSEEDKKGFGFESGCSSGMDSGLLAFETCGLASLGLFATRMMQKRRREEV